MGREIDLVPVAFIVVGVAIVMLIAFMMWQSQQGYNAWVAQLTSQGGVLICQDSKTQLIQFKK